MSPTCVGGKSEHMGQVPAVCRQHHFLAGLALVVFGVRVWGAAGTPPPGPDGLATRSFHSQQHLPKSVH